MEMDRLIIDPPNELRFQGPFNRPVVTIMKLINPTNQMMLFKIKTTAPKRYCVRPNFGSINAKSETKVEICLQHFVYDANEKNKHKFMVQSLFVPADCNDFNKWWKDADSSQLMDAKLKCVFDNTAPAAPEETSVVREMTQEAIKDTPKNIEEAQLMNYAKTEQADIVMELSQLRDENNSLRKEHLNLKEQLIRLRSSRAKPPVDEAYAPVMVEKPIPMFYIAISIAAAIFGILLGKYLL